MVRQSRNPHTWRRCDVGARRVQSFLDPYSMLGPGLVEPLGTPSLDSSTDAEGLGLSSGKGNEN